MFRGPVINKGESALGAKGASDDNILGLILGGVLPEGAGGGSDGEELIYPALGTSVKLIQASDADALGITSAYDANNKILVRNHINEFFRLDPSGVLWVMIVPQGTTQEQMWDKTILTNSVQKLIIDSGKKIKSIGSVLNPEAGYDPELENGIDPDVTAAVLKAQQLIESWTNENIFIDMAVIEGRNLGLTASEWINNRELASPNVHVWVGQDKDVADLDAEYENYAAVGTFLGGLGVRRPEEDMGSINCQNNPTKGQESYPINNAADGIWLRPAISSGKLCQDLTAPEVKLLKDNALVFADSYPEYAGVFFSGSAACVDLTSDYAYGVNTRVWNKFARRTVAKLTPKFNSLIETVNGNIKPTTIFAWESDVNNSTDGLNSLVTDGHAQAAKSYIDPNQDVFGTGKLTTKVKVVPFTYARELEGEIGFSKSL